MLHFVLWCPLLPHIIAGMRSPCRPYRLAQANLTRCALPYVVWLRDPPRATGIADTPNFTWADIQGELGALPSVRRALRHEAVRYVIIRSAIKDARVVQFVIVLNRPPKIRGDFLHFLLRFALLHFCDCF